MFEIALSDPLSSRCCSVCNCAKTACPNHRNVRFKLFPVLRTSTGSLSSPRTSRFPNSIIKQQCKMFDVASATAFNHNLDQPRRQASNALFGYPQFGSMNRRPRPIPHVSVSPQTFAAGLYSNRSHQPIQPPIVQQHSTLPGPYRTPTWAV